VAGPPEHRVEVAGRASERIAPDRAEWTVRVIEREMDAKMAFERCAARAHAVAEALELALGDDGWVITRGVRIGERWDSRRQREQGFEAAAAIRVMTPVARAGEAAEVAMDAGADGVEGPRFVVSDADERREALIGAAVDAARRKAERAAAAAGRRLGRVAIVLETDGLHHPGDDDVVYAVAASTTQPRVDSDELELSAGVRVTFELED
jgi:uncharacterized protein YggE